MKGETAWSVVMTDGMPTDTGRSCWIGLSLFLEGELVSSRSTTLLILGCGLTATRFGWEEPNSGGTTCCVESSNEMGEIDGFETWVADNSKLGMFNSSKFGRIRFSKVGLPFGP